MNNEIKISEEFILPRDLSAIITDGKEEQIKEIHWYQCANIGKIEFKIKDWEEKNAT